MTTKKNATKQSSRAISSEEFDVRFEKGDDVSQHLDLERATARVNVDFPTWVIKALDHESGRLGISRQALIKVWITERLDLLSRAAAKKGERDAASPG